MNLLKGNLGKQRKLHNKNTIMCFLAQESWSCNHILKQLLGHKTNSSVIKVCNQLQKQGMLNSIMMENNGKLIKIWGITRKGIDYTPTQNTENVIENVFYPSRVSSRVIPHKIGLQRLRIDAENQGWTWERGDSGEAHKKETINPDAIITKGVKKIAIEYERSTKSLKKYQDIFVNHSKSLTKGNWKEVWYCGPSNVINRVQRLFSKISYLRVNGKKVEILARHFEPFKFIHEENYIESLKAIQTEEINQ